MEEVEATQQHWIKDIIVPLVISIVVGVGSSYLATSVAVAVLDAQVKELRNDVIDMRVVVQAVQANQVELAKRGNWMINVEKDLKGLNDIVIEMSTNRYTDVDARRDKDAIIREIKLRHNERVE